MAWKQLGRESLFGGCSLYIMTSDPCLPSARAVQKMGKICILRSPWSVGGLAAVPLSVNIPVSHTAWQSTRLRIMLPAPGSPLPPAAWSCSCPFQTSFEKFFKVECSNYIFCTLIYIWFILFAVLLYPAHSLPPHCSSLFLPAPLSLITESWLQPVYSYMLSSLQTSQPPAVLKLCWVFL